MKVEEELFGERGAKEGDGKGNMIEVHSIRV
jgi:hypothetical protein